MATYYWNPAADSNWSGTAWATTFNGVPANHFFSSSDTAIFTAHNSHKCTYNIAVIIVNLYFNNADNGGNGDYVGEFVDDASHNYIGIKADIKLSAGMTFNHTGLIFMYPTGSVTSAGHTWNSAFYVQQAGTVTQNDDFATLKDLQMSVANGIWDTNDYDFSVGRLILYFSTVSLILGSGTYLINGGISGDIHYLIGNITGAYTLKFTNTSNYQMTIYTGSHAYNNIWFDRGTSTGNIYINNAYASSNPTFVDFKDTGVAAHNLYFSPGTTTTVTTFNVSGTVGNLISISSYGSTATHTLACASGIIGCDYLNIQHCIANGGASFYAGRHSVDNQGVATTGSGWIFTDAPFTNPANIYALDGTYTTSPAPSGLLNCEISKDGGTNYSNLLTQTFTGSDSTLTYGAGATELWGSSYTRADVVNANLRIRLSHGTYSQVYKTFGFATGTDILTGIEVAVRGKYASSTLSLDVLEVKIHYGTSILPIQGGSMAYASNGRKNGEGAGSGTGVLVYYDQANHWIASDTGVTVAA